MKIIACQYNKISGPDAVSNYKIEFTVDESQRKGVLNLISLKKGTPLLLMMYEVDREEHEMKELTDETEQQARLRFISRIHVLIKEIAKDKNMSNEEVKKSVKDYLIKRKIMKESLKELNLNQLAIAIYYLQTEYGQE